jgi:hypothetical protein
MSTAAASQGFMCKLKDRKEVSEGTMAFQFEKPLGWSRVRSPAAATFVPPHDCKNGGN